jgi:hypothetical protein
MRKCSTGSKHAFLEALNGGLAWLINREGQMSKTEPSGGR